MRLNKRTYRRYPGIPTVARARAAIQSSNCEYSAVADAHTALSGLFSTSFCLFRIDDGFDFIADVIDGIDMPLPVPTLQCYSNPYQYTNIALIWVRLDLIGRRVLESHYTFPW
jgi:hypothetical protein